MRNEVLGVLNIGFHQWTITSLGTLTQRRSIGSSQPISFTYNVLYCPVYLLDKGVIINVNISNE